MAGWAAAEASVGLAIGVSVSIALEAFAISAQIMGLQAGYSYATTVDPNSEGDSGILLVLAQMFAGMLFFALGLDRETLRLFAQSLDKVPAGAFVLGLPAAQIVIRLGASLFAVGMRLALPVVALLILLTTGRPDAGLIAAGVAGLGLIAAALTGLALLLRSEPFALRADRSVQGALAIVCRLIRRQPPAGVPGSLLGFRNRAAALLIARGWRITAATVAGNLALWLVLLACLRGTGLSQAQVPWQTSLAAFAFVRLLTALPVTPGGLGITELGLIGTLAASADHRATAQVTAAVLLYRAVTYLPPIPLGALACLVWRHAPALIHASPHHTEANPEIVSRN